MRHALLALALAGCGGSWTAADAQNATDVANVEIAMETVCSVDAGTCKAGAVRALQRAAYCASASELYRHKLPVPDAGITCQASP